MGQMAPPQPSLMKRGPVSQVPRSSGQVTEVKEEHRPSGLGTASFVELLRTSPLAASIAIHILESFGVNEGSAGWSLGALQWSGSETSSVIFKFYSRVWRPWTWLGIIALALIIQKTSLDHHCCFLSLVNLFLVILLHCGKRQEF